MIGVQQIFSEAPHLSHLKLGINKNENCNTMNNAMVSYVYRCMIKKKNNAKWNSNDLE